jgi:hypothetical protein
VITVTETQNLGVGGRTGRTRRLVGVLVVALGLLLLVDSTGLVAVDGFEAFLAGALVVYGAVRLVGERGRHLFWPGTALLVGGLWLAVLAGVLSASRAWQLWPAVVVLFGVSLLHGRRRPFGPGTLADGAGDVTAVFEDARLDLRGLALPSPAGVDAVAVFGDVDVVVPEDRVVAVDGTTLFGEIRDLRRARPSGDPDLVVDAVALFGDVTVSD